LKRKYAIVLELSGELEKQTRNAWKILSKKLNIDYVSSYSPCPHIAIEYGFLIKSEDSFCKLLQDSYRYDLKQFKISSFGLGILVRETPVIYLRWVRDKHFEDFKRKINQIMIDANQKNLITNYKENENWFPKTTLAFQDTDYDKLTYIIDDLRKIDLNKEFFIKTFSLYSYTDQPSETKIKDFIIEK